jgi:hypothetical protein
MSTSKVPLVLPCVESVVIRDVAVITEICSLEELYRLTEVSEVPTIFQGVSFPWLERPRAWARAELAGRTR